MGLKLQQKEPIAQAVSAGKEEVEESTLQSCMQISRNLRRDCHRTTEHCSTDQADQSCLTLLDRSTRAVIFYGNVTLTDTSHYCPVKTGNAFPMSSSAV